MTEPSSPSKPKPKTAELTGFVDCPVYKLDDVTLDAITAVLDHHPGTWISTQPHPGPFPVYTVFTTNPEAFGFAREEVTDE